MCEVSIENNEITIVETKKYTSNSLVSSLKMYLKDLLICFSDHYYNDINEGTIYNLESSYSKNDYEIFQNLFADFKTSDDVILYMCDNHEIELYMHLIQLVIAYYKHQTKDIEFSLYCLHYESLDKGFRPALYNRGLEFIKELERTFYEFVESNELQFDYYNRKEQRITNKRVVFECLIRGF